MGFIFKDVLLRAAFPGSVSVLTKLPLRSGPPPNNRVANAEPMLDKPLIIASCVEASWLSYQSDICSLAVGSGRTSGASGPSDNSVGSIYRSVYSSFISANIDSSYWSSIEGTAISEKLTSGASSGSKRPCSFSSCRIPIPPPCALLKYPPTAIPAIPYWSKSPTSTPASCSCCSIIACGSIPEPVESAVKALSPEVTELPSIGLISISGPGLKEGEVPLPIWAGWSGSPAILPLM